MGISAYTVPNVSTATHTEDGNHKYGFEFVNCQMF